MGYLSACTACHSTANGEFQLLIASKSWNLSSATSKHKLIITADLKFPPRLNYYLELPDAKDEVLSQGSILFLLNFRYFKKELK